MEAIERLTTDADRVTGTDGDDVVSAPPSNANLRPEDVLDLGAGTDTLIMERTGFLGLTAAKLAGASGLDVIDMSAADDLRFAGDDALLAQSDAGTVRLVWGAAPLFLDLRDMAGPAAGYVLAGTGPVTLADIDQSVAVADGTDGTVRGGALADALRGGSGADDLSGGAGNDTVAGGGGDDSLSGGAGNDDLRAGAGDDTVSGGSGFDLISGGTGANRLSGGSGSDVFAIRQGSTVTVTDFDLSDAYERIDLRGIPDLTFGAMTISNHDGGARVAIDATTTLILEGVDADALTADPFAFAGQEMASLAEALGVTADFFFTGEADDFRGGAGAQVFELTGSFGKLAAEDMFDGGAGTDTLRVDGADRSLSIARLEGMSGIEIIDLSAATGSHRVVVDPLMRAQADDGVLTIRHGGGALTLDAIAPAGTVIVEGHGEVSLRSEDGQAVTISDAIGGVVTGGDSGDLITGGARADRIDGGVGDDTIDGGLGDDTLLGGEGDDTFLLGGADVTVTGGGGHDTYVIRPGAGRITITDLDTTDYLERIDLSATSVRGRSDVSLSISDGDVRLTADGLDLLLEGAAGARFGVDDFLIAGQRDDRFRVEADAPLRALQSLLDDAPDGTVIQLGAGTFDFDAPLRIDRSNITVKGAGEGKTVLVNRIRDADIGDAAAHAFLVMPDDMERPLGHLAQDVAEGSRTMVLEDGHGLSVGDLLFVQTANDAAWLAETGNTGWQPQDPGPGKEKGLWLREFRSRVVEVDGNAVTLAEATPYAFEAGVAEAIESTFLSEVHLSGFTIRGRWGDPDSYEFSNTMDPWANTTGLEFDGVRDSSLRDITTENLASNAFRFQRVHESEAIDLTAIGAHNKAGANGVHFLFAESFANTLTGFTSIGARHGVEFSSYSAEHYNTVQVDFMDRDVNFHGSPDTHNTVTVDRMVMDYPELVFPQWRAVSPGGWPLHPRATIEENDVTFLHAETGDRKDIVTANDAGGYLDTGYGNDSLTGGAGDDTLIGGTQGDTLEGRGGSDRFVWGLGDGTDTILDFETGRGGDVLVLRGTGFTDIAQLRFERSEGQTVLKLGTFGEMRFGDTDMSGLTAANVAFEAADGPAVAIETARAVYDNLLGSSGDDGIGIQGLHLEMDDFVLAMGGGDDVATVGIREFFGAFHTTGTYGGVDVFDFSALERGEIAISRSLVAQSDTGVLTLAMGDGGGIVTLSAGGLGDGLRVDGARAIRLSDGAANEITLTDRAGGNVTGGARADTITGGAANDVIKGGGGDDEIGGGAGADRLTGGAGRDAFVFEVPGAAFRGADRVTDFTKGQDRVVLDIPDGLYGAGRMPAGAFSGSGAPQDRGDRVIYDRETGTLSIDLDGTGPAGAKAIARFDGSPDLTAADIFLA